MFLSGVMNNVEPKCVFHTATHWAGCNMENAYWNYDNLSHLWNISGIYLRVPNNGTGKVYLVEWIVVCFALKPIVNVSPGVDLVSTDTI